MNEEFTSKQNELKSRIDVTVASVEEIKNTPKGYGLKAVVAFRATCAKNFSDSYKTRQSENPGNNFLQLLFKIKST